MDIKTNDPGEAAALLAEIKQEDQCTFPACGNPKRKKTLGERGPAPEYCSDPEHTPLKKERAIKRLNRIARDATGETSTMPKLPPIETISLAQTSAIGAMDTAMIKMEIFVSMLSDMTNPEISAAQAQANREQAELDVKTAQAAVSQERKLRLEAEDIATKAKELAEAEHRAAELAIKQKAEAEDKIKEIEQETAEKIALIQEEKEEAEARVVEIERDAAEQIALIQEEKEDAILASFQEATRRIEAAQEQAKKDIDAIQKQATKDIDIAHKERDEAIARAQTSHDAAVRAEAAAATAQQIMRQAQQSLEHEQEEIKRLRQELAQIETDHKTEIGRITTAYETRLQRDERDNNQLREDLRAAREQATTATKRADQLATLADDLRAQLVTATSQPAAEPPTKTTTRKTPTTKE